MMMLNEDASATFKRRFLFSALACVSLSLVCALSLLGVLTAHRVLQINITPIAQIQTVEVSVNNGPFAAPPREMFVHPGFHIAVRRGVMSNVKGKVYLEKIFNNSDSRVLSKPSFTSLNFNYGPNTMMADLVMTPDLPLYVPLHYEVSVFNYKNAPGALSDITICIFPLNDPLPTVQEICAPPARREKWLETLITPP